MAKTPPRRPSPLYDRKKETIAVPTKRETSAASRDLRKRDPAGARAMADASVAKRQQKPFQPKRPR